MYFISSIPVNRLLSLTATSFVVTFEPANLLNPQGTAIWRSTDLTARLVGNFDVARTIDFWGLWYTNAQSTDTARLRLANSEAALTAAPLFDSGALNIHESLVGVGPNAGDLTAQGWTDLYIHQRSQIPIIDQVSATWFDIECDFTSNTLGSIDVGRLFLDTLLRPGFGQISGWQYQPLARSRHIVALASGGLSAGGGTYKRNLPSASFLGLTREEAWGKLELLLRDRADILPIGIVLDEDEVTYPMHQTFHGYLSTPAIVAQSNRQTTTISVTEP